MYVMVCTSLDISHVVEVLRRLLANPSKAHWDAVKWIFRYLRGTSKVCLSLGDQNHLLKVIRILIWLET